MPNETEPDLCPRCRAEHLRAWRELSAEEREVARRLPASADFARAERETLHRWCARCWHEETRDVRRDA